MKKVSATHLPDHETTLPALGVGGAEAGRKLGGAHVAVGRVSGSRGLANDELAEGDAVLGDLEERRAGERTARLGDQALAGRVDALVVELHVVL